MPDVTIIRTLLAAHAPLTAVVPAARIAAGPITQGAQLPAISVAHVIATWGNQISQQSRDCTARVQVTVKAANYPQQKQIIALVRAAIPRMRGTVAGVQVDSILRDVSGPDFRDDDAGIYLQSQDFFVKYID